MKRNRMKRIRRKAFTLLEVLMVIVILGILAALIVPSFLGTQRGAEINATRAQVKGLDNDIERFRLDCGRYPSEQEGMAALVTKPDDEELADKWHGPYLKDPAKDAWGTPLGYRSPGQYNETSYDLWSFGPDKQEGTDDDITNWKK